MKTCNGFAFDQIDGAFQHHVNNNENVKYEDVKNMDWGEFMPVLDSSGLYVVLVLNTNDADYATPARPYYPCNHCYECAGELDDKCPLCGHRFIDQNLESED